MQRRTLIQAAGMAALGGPRAFAAEPTHASGSAPPCEWRSVPFGAGGFVDGFVFHPRERELLYARTDIGGCYRFDPAANAWVPLLDHLGKADADLMGVLSLAVDPQDPQRLYAACGLYLDARVRPGALLASADRGANWQVHELGIHIGGNAPGRGSGERLQVDPNDGRVLLLGSSQDGLLRSSDRGHRFSPLPGFAPRHVSLVLIDPASGAPGGRSATVYVGSHDAPGLYVSHDGGERFTREESVPRQVPQHAAFGPDGALYVSFALGQAPVACNPSYARTGSVWKRDAQGRWHDITPQRPGPGVLGFGYSGLDVHPGGRLVVSTIERWHEGDEIFLSDDGGAHWHALGAQSRHDTQHHAWLDDYMRSERNMGHWLSALKLDPFDAERALHGTGYGVWTTRNLGDVRRADGTVQWHFTVANFEETATLEIRSPAEGARLLAAMGDVAGGAWADPAQPLGDGFFTPPKETNRSVDFAELAQQVIARTGDGPSGGHWSDDGGAHWHAFAASPRRGRVQAGSIAVCARGTAFVYAPQRGAALWTRDRGAHWAPCEGWPAPAAVPLKPVADRAAEGVFYVHDRERGELRASRDGGRRFERLLEGLPVLRDDDASQLLAAPGQAGELWLALPDRLLHLPGPGRRPHRIEPVAAAWMIALGCPAPGSRTHALYVWGRVRAAGAPPVEGLFRSDDGGAHFVRINDDAHRYGRLLSMAADAREHGVLYLAPHGRGVIVGRPRKAGA